MAKVMLYVLDFDDTLFNTKKLKTNHLFNCKWDNNIKDLSSNYDKIKKIYWKFNFDEWVKLSNISDNEISHLWDCMPNLLYKDWIEFMKKIKNNWHKIIVLTFWEKDYQEFKLAKSWIHKYVDEIIRTEDETKKDDLNLIYKKNQSPITYIDNKVFVKETDFNFSINIIKIDRIEWNWDVKSFDEVDLTTYIH